MKVQNIKIKDLTRILAGYISGGIDSVNIEIRPSDGLENNNQIRVTAFSRKSESKDLQSTYKKALITKSIDNSFDLNNFKFLI